MKLILIKKYIVAVSSSEEFIGITGPHSVEETKAYQPQMMVLQRSMGIIKQMDPTREFTYAMLTYKLCCHSH